MTPLMLDDAELDGVFACADTLERVPGVLALGGSDGGIPKYFQRLLAPERCACLALAYHGTPKTQPALVEVPLERLERALRWLRDHPKVATRDGRVAVVGASKGAELALVLAGAFPDLVGPVVAYTPSSVVWGGIDFSAAEPPMRSSWSKSGKPLERTRVAAVNHCAMTQGTGPPLTLNGQPVTIHGFGCCTVNWLDTLTRGFRTVACA